MNSDPPLPAPANTGQPPAPLPPLRIHHFMLWMAAVAASMTLFSKDLREAADMPFAFYLDGFCRSITQAIATATFGLGVYWRLHGLRFFSAVGHWLLSMIAAHFLIGALLGAIVNHYLSRWLTTSWVSALNNSFTLSNLLISTVLVLIAGFKVADTKTWKWFCLVAGLGYALQFVWTGYAAFLFNPFSVWNKRFLQAVIYVIALGLPALCVLMCFRAIYVDHRLGISRHWSHWCGVLLWMIEVLSRSIWMVTSLVLRVF